MRRPDLRHIGTHLLALATVLSLVAVGGDRVVRDAIVDTRFELLSRPASGDVVVVAIDSPSINRLGVWPWPRTVHADLLEKLDRAGAAGIAFDIDFSSPSKPTDDHAFEAALRAVGGSTILPSFKQMVRTDGNKLYVDRPLPQFGQWSWTASVNIEADVDGVLRRYRRGDVIDGVVLPSLATLLGGGKMAPGSFLIDFGISRGSVPTLSYHDVLDGGDALFSSLKDKKVIVGATAVELGDRIQVPNGQIIPGALLQALATESVLQGRTLQATAPAIGIAGAVAIAILMAALWRKRSGAWRAALLVAISFLAELGAVLLQANTPVVADTSLLHFTVLAYIVVAALDELDLRRRLQTAADRRFQQVAMALGDGLVFYDRRGMITFWNPGAEAIFTYRATDMVGTPFATILVDDPSRQAPRQAMRPALSELLERSGSKTLELEGRRSDGTVFPLDACISSWTDADGPQFAAILRDVSERKRRTERILYLARHDTLTGLPNRNALYEELKQAIRGAPSHKREIALLMLDLDRFKDVNDTLGHRYGDELLVQVAARLREIVGPEGFVARMSGDEFTIVLIGADLAEDAEQLSKRILTSFKTWPFLLAGESIRIETSIGMSIYPRDCDDQDELLANADLAMYKAKSSGHNKHAVFDPSLKLDLESRRLLLAELDRALVQGEFELFYQPQVRLADGLLIGAEALIRWRHPVRGIISPGVFMPTVNTNVIGEKVAAWVLTTACRQGGIWEERGQKLKIGVNLSPSQFKTGDLAASVMVALADSGLSPEHLELEVTENILLDDDDRTIETFQRLRNLGVGIAFDDFGTGYASLSYLKKFPLTRLKIDQSFVRALAPGTVDAGIVEYTIRLSRLMQLDVIAEGIETQATADLLHAMGCENGQGYLFGRPLSVPEFEHAFLAAAKCGRRKTGNGSLVPDAA
ncbi:EAL domain-containing protein [Rhodoplanes elegans]|uniref:EAL domain-containing protein n=1 Tax=Rhodoplanes elegans TaxID=29408 RepID=UPI001FE1063F|nr:EAL domain-containing protein [Rhodoplanes elegans]